MLTRVRNAMRARHPEGRRSEFEAQNGNRPHYERRGLHPQLQDGRRRHQAVDPHLFEVHAVANEPVMSHIERISRPGCRVYVGSKEVQRVLGGLGINILTTPRGVMTGSTRPQRECGRRTALQNLVKDLREMSRVGKKPIPLPKGVKLQIGKDSGKSSRWKDQRVS